MTGESADIPGKYTWVPDESGEEWPCPCGGTMRALKVDPPRGKSYLSKIHLCDGPDCREQPGGPTTKDGRALLPY